MFGSLMATLAGFITGAISALGYGGIVLLMAIESACVPLPSEIVMPFAGYLVSTGRFNLWLVATAGAVGCSLGSTLAWLVGAWGGRPAVDRWGRYILLDQGAVDAAERWFRTYGSLTVFVGRLLPVVRTFISLPAGTARMPFWKFQIYTFVGSWLWCLALAWMGLKLGKAWDRSPMLRNVMHALDGVVVLAVVVGLVWFVRRRLNAERR